MEPSTQPSAKCSVPAGWRLFWRIVLTAHATLAGAAWWLLPSGFPVVHARFWSNTVVPAFVLLAAASGAYAAWKQKLGWLQAMIVMPPAGWLCAALTARLLFPVSAHGVWLAALGVAAALAAAAWRSLRGSALAWPRCAVAMIAASLAGAGTVLAQRSPPPGTLPLDAPLPQRTTAQNTAGRLDLDGGTEIDPGNGWVTVRMGDLTIGVAPLLTFESRSPDRCWTALAPRRDRFGPARSLVGGRRDGRVCQLYYEDDDASVLAVEAGSETQVTAFSRLPQPVFSHLNTFCELAVHGHSELAIEFSACSGKAISVEPSDYPFGKPARIAYVDADRRFVVVEARSGEKGPFRTLAAGELKQHAPLGLTLLDQGEPVCRIVFDDWAAQADTQLSPTAGWGLPANAIEFSRSDDSASSSASIWLTLAGTSVGRGWDSVGHAAGTYRNRIRIGKAARGSTR